MEDIAYLLVPFAQIGFGAATIGAILQGMESQKTRKKAYLVPVVIWGWILGAIGSIVLIVLVKFKYQDADSAPEWMPVSVPSLGIYGALLGVLAGSLLGALLGRRRWNQWQREPATVAKSEKVTS